VYVSGGGSRQDKFSFHQSKACHSAFYEEHVPVSVANRVMHEWKRADTPPPECNRACMLFQLRVPTDYLSTALPTPSKNVSWINPAPIGKTRAVCVILTNDTEDRLRLDDGSFWNILAYEKLPNGEAVAVITYELSENENDVAIPASHHQRRHIIMSRHDPGRTGRPVRFYAQNKPRDGDYQEVTEMGGYYHDGPLPPGIAIFKRTTVIATQNTPVKSRLRDSIHADK